MKNPQAKDIRKMLGVNSSRYDYLASRFGITPEVEEVTGRGGVNTYSFRNALQFAIADRISRFGLSPGHVRLVLSNLDSENTLHPDEVYWHQRDKETIKQKKENYLSKDTEDELYLVISFLRQQQFDLTPRELKKELDKTDPPSESISFNLALTYFQNMEDVNDWLQMAPVIPSTNMVVDLSRIKNEVRSFLTVGKVYPGFW